MSPRRVWGKVSRAFSASGPRAQPAAELPSFATLDEALEFARTTKGPKVETSPNADQLRFEEVPVWTVAIEEPALAKAT